MVSDFAAKHVMIDNGSALNLCTLKFIKQVGYTEVDIINEVITIKAYDNLEHTTEGTILLPIRVSPVTQETLFHVIDLNLPYNILLGHPWIHSMKAIPSTYHQCIKFLHNGTEITIHADPKPFAYCNAVEASYTNQCLGINIATTMANSSSTCHDSNTILASTLSMVKINYQGCGEYSLTNAFVVGALPLDPHTQGCPIHQGPIPKATSQLHQLVPTTFVTKGILDGAENTLDMNTWLYKEPPHKSEALLDHFKQKYPWSHQLAMEQWDYQGGGLGC